MDRLEISLGDFLKNAGITGLSYALENHGAREGIDYGISDDKYTFWIDRAFALDTDWTDVYFKAFVKYLGPETVLPEVEKRIDSCISKLENDKWEATKENKEQQKYINDKMLSNSYKAGFENIKEAAGSDEVKCMEAYEQLKKEKLSEKMDEELLTKRLKGLKVFLSNDICQETFAMKSIIYSFINRFWDGKSFLLPANAKKNMREMFAKDFSVPLAEYLKTDHSRSKDSCIECGMLNKFDWSVSAGYSEAEQHPDLIEKRLKSSIEKSLDGKFRPAQEYMREHSEDNLVVIAPTGSGKTEAALLWLDGEKGFYTLPMMVSSDAIYDRIRERYGYKEAALLHSGSMKRFLKESSEKGDGYSRYEKAKLLSAPLTVCTVDQLFKFSYKAAGTEIFAATLKYSKVIIDEIQSYSSRVVAALIYGLKTISEMGGRFAIITATFPPVLKKLMEEHGLHFGKECYLQDFSGGSELKRHIVSVRDGEMDIDEILGSARGRKVLVICNTVRKAQSVYESLREMDGNVKLLHAGFIRKHRDLLEKSIMDFSMQEGAEGIWVTTQIVEASLDIDFDILYTEMCPIDSLLQRMGRCNRSGRYFPEHHNIIVHDTKNGRKTIYDEVIYDESLRCIRKITGGVLFEKMKTECVNEVYGSPEIEKSNYYKEIKEMLRHFEKILFAEYSKSEADESFRKIRSTTVMPDSIYEKNRDWIDACSKILSVSHVGAEIKAIVNAKLDALTLNVASYDKRYRNAMDKDPIQGTFIHKINENCAGYDFDEETLSGKGLFIKDEEEQETFVIC